MHEATETRREGPSRLPLLVRIGKGLGSLIGLSLLVFLSLQTVSWLTELYSAYQPGTDASASRAQGLFLAGVLWVMPFGFHVIVWLFASRFGEESYLANLARGLRVSLFAWLSQVVLLWGLDTGGFDVLWRVPAVLLAWSICATAHWRIGRARKDDESTKILQMIAWIVLLWTLVGYISLLVSSV